MLVIADIKFAKKPYTTASDILIPICLNQYITYAEVIIGTGLINDIKLTIII
jgi:hypothetical protein